MIEVSTIKLNNGVATPSIGIGLGGIGYFDFSLTDEEIKAIDSININSRLRFDPDNLDFHSVG